MNSRRFPRDLPAFILIFCAAVGAYLPSAGGALLWDDAAHITRPDLRSWEGLFRIWSVPGATQQYYPLLHSGFWIEHRIWGDSVLGYHLLNITLHALSACLVVLVVRRLGLRGAWLAGLLFALHPVCVESVAWISEQKSTLSGIFYLGAALAYLKFAESSRRSQYLTASALFLAALLTKTVTATLPGALLVVLWWRHGRLGWRRDVRPLLPWIALGAAAGLFTAWVEHTLIGARGAEFALSPLDRLIVAGRALWFYVAKIVWPIDLTFFYPRWTLDPTQALYLVGAVAVVLALWRYRGALAAVLIFAGTLFPVLGFFNIYPFRYSFVADHFAYLAVLAIVIPAAAIVPWRVGIAIAAILGIFTFRQSAIYRNEETLYRATIDRNPAAWLAHNNLANLLLDRPNGRAEALAHLQTALQLKPDFAEAHLTMGNLLVQTPGRLQDAIAEYETAARLTPNSERAHTNLGNALMQAGRTPEAIDQLTEALRIDPANAEAHNDLANALSQFPNRLEDAIAQYRLALDAKYDFAEAHNNLGRALAQAGRLPEAIAEFEAAIRIQPAYANAHSNLGNALSMIPGRLNDAIAEYRIAVRLRPDSAALHNNLGYALSHIPGSAPEAIAEYKEALRLDPNFVPARANLAAQR